MLPGADQCVRLQIVLSLLLLMKFAYLAQERVQIVQHRPRLAGHPVPLGGGFGHANEGPQLIGRECSPVPSAVQSHVQWFKVRKRVIRCSSILHHPPAELLDGLQVEIEQSR